jgi:hypothetical protein
MRLKTIGTPGSAMTAAGTWSVSIVLISASHSDLAAAPIWRRNATEDVAV